MTEPTEAPGAERDLIPARANARRMYETTDLSFDAVAAEVGVSRRTVLKWSSQDGYWQKRNVPTSTAERARIMAELASNLQPDQAPDAAPAEAVAEPDPREMEAKLMEKHQRMWRVVDGLSAEAVRSRDDRTARVAHTLARTFAIAQRSERIAYGLGTGETPSTTFVVERE